MRNLAATACAWVLGWLALGLSSGVACPFCSAVSQTLRQEMEQMDTAAIGRIVPGTETDSDAEFELVTIIRGGDLVKQGQRMRVNYFGKAKEGQHFLLMGVDPPDLLWSSPLPVSDRAIEYVQAISKLPKDEALTRLKFYLDYLEHPEPILARDAYDEFASAPYEEIKLLKPEMDREQLLTWIKDTSLPPDRKRLYLVMLGVCGKPSDADLLEELLRSEDPNRRAGLDAMIACYATLKGDSGLQLIDELFLTNKKSQYADTYAAIMALRFHGTDGGVIDKERVLQSLRLILDRPELADLVIPDLARWGDWSQIEKLVELFKSADDKSSWVRVPVITYLRACPLPVAEEKLAELKELDPAAYKRASSFFPVPKAAAGTNESSSIAVPGAVRGLASSDQRIDGSDLAGKAGLLAAGVRLEASRVAATGEERFAIAGQPTNRTFVVGVISMVACTLWLAMWISISGAGNYGFLVLAPLSKQSQPPHPHSR